MNRHRMNAPATLAVLTAALCSGCLMGPDYQRPDVPEEPKFHRQTETPVDPSSLADLPWWELFKDPQLQALIRTALEENKDLLLAAARVEEARARLGFVRSDLFPQAEAEAAMSYRRIPGTVTPGVPSQSNIESDVYKLRGALQTWELDLWGRIRRATEAARADLVASEEARRGIVISLVADVAQAYFELREVDLELDISRRTLQSRRKYLRIVSDRHRDGLVSGLDVAKAEAEVHRVSARIPDLERQAAQREHAISLLLGRNPGGVDRGVALTEQVVPPVVPAGLPASLLERRPDIRQAEQQVIAANAQVGVAAAEFFPKVTLTGDYGVWSRQLNDLFIGPSQFWGIGPAVSVPLFTAGKLRSNLDETEARKQQSLIRYHQAIQQSFREVDDALVATEKSRQVKRELEKLVASNRKALELAAYRYEEGLSDYIDVLDAQRQLYDSEIEHARIERAQLLSVVHLYKALGGGWAPGRQQAEQPVADPAEQTGGHAGRSETEGAGKEQHAPAEVFEGDDRAVKVHEPLAVSRREPVSLAGDGEDMGLPNGIELRGIQDGR